MYTRNAAWLLPTGLEATLDGAGHDRVECLNPFSETWRSAEASLLSAGMALPLPHRSQWNQHMHPRNATGLCLRAGQPRPDQAWTVLDDDCRAMPGHRILRVERYGANPDAASLRTGLLAMQALCRSIPRVLRLEFGVFSRDAAVHETVAQAASALGWRPLTPPRHGYAHTLALELGPDEDTLMTGFSRSVRRNIRAPAKHGLHLAPVTSADCAPRMDALLAETFARTGGAVPACDWAQVIAFSSAHPGLSRISGCWADPRQRPSDLMSFAWGCHHGDHVAHTSAAATRQHDSNLALSYATSWDLIRWARREGCRWFDFGGVTEGQLGSDDRLGGISDVKRLFGGTPVTVGSEWVFEPSPRKARLADVVSTLAQGLRRLGSPGTADARPATDMRTGHAAARAR
ncbi:MAG: hypothetical protein RIQ53_4837 [Pseudomonadota bacterium]|jgi:hypothetical protein